MIHIFGLGANGLPSLSVEATEVLGTCKTLFGGSRHLDLVPDGPVKHTWPVPWRLPVDEIKTAKGPVGVLVSGDPTWFSASKGLVEAFECRIWPVAGAFSLAAAHMGWALEDVVCDSIHGRDKDKIQDIASSISCEGGRYFLLSDVKSLTQLIEFLTQLDFTPVTRLILLCNLGAKEESRITLDLDDPVMPDLNLFTIAIDLEPAPKLVLDADFLPDGSFKSHGKITKFEARQSAVANLRRADVMWDVGAGAGTVGLQAAYSLQTRQVFLIENDPEALDVLEDNCANSSAPVTIIRGTAPDALIGLPPPDAVFLGGGLTEPGVLESCYNALQPEGRLVAHAVTLESEKILVDFFLKHPKAQLNRMQFGTASPVGDFQGWRPTMPLTQLVIEKPA